MRKLTQKLKHWQVKIVKYGQQLVRDGEENEENIHLN